MRDYQARQVKLCGGWHYTCAVDRDGGIFAVGDCAKHNPHATKEEAEDCYRKYLSRRVHLVKREDAQYKCMECGEFTSDVVTVAGTHSLVLCQAHSAEEFVYKHLGPVTHSVQS
jgi:hypothetical protein